MLRAAGWPLDKDGDGDGATAAAAVAVVAVVAEATTVPAADADADADAGADADADVCALSRRGGSLSGRGPSLPSSPPLSNESKLPPERGGETPSWAVRPSRCPLPSFSSSPPSMSPVGAGPNGACSCGGGDAATAVGSRPEASNLSYLSYLVGLGCSARSRSLGKF